MSEEDASLGGVRCPASGPGEGEGVEEGGGRVGAPAGVWESAGAEEGAGWAGGAVEGGDEGEGAEEECLAEEVGEGVLFLLGRGWGMRRWGFFWCALFSSHWEDSIGVR